MNYYENYSLLISSPIPVFTDSESYKSIDLWVADIKENLSHVSKLTIFCPRAEHRQLGYSLLPVGVEVVFFDQIHDFLTLDLLISKHDIISIGAGAPFWKMKMALECAKRAYKLKKCVVTFISSNRQKTTIMNVANGGVLMKAKAWIVSWGIKCAISKLVRLSTGVVTIGKGVFDSLNIQHAIVSIETASWVKTSDVVSDEKIDEKIAIFKRKNQIAMIIATRLEAMKGVDVGIEAVNLLKKSYGLSVTMSILGKGIELENLKKLIVINELDSSVKLDGERSYPEDFYKEISQFDIGLLTNLNVEQPRLLFDFISQGLVPLCPDSSAYLYLNLPQQIYYKTGDPSSLAEACIRLSDPDIYTTTMRELRSFAFEYTIEGMHKKRHDWMMNLLCSSNLKLSSK